jgi:hypothetical protein
MRFLPVVLALGMSVPCAAVPASFPPHEEKCAAAIGVSLAPVKGREYDPKRAAWVCPVIVRGQVVDVETATEGAYPTRLVVHVDATEKGSIPYRDVRVLIEADERTVSVYEPSLEMGDEVLLFLQTDAKTQLAAGEYRPCLDAYVVRDDKLVSAISHHPEEIPTKATLDAVRKTVRAQSACKP